MKILITGANGFLGQHLSVHLKKQGFHVIATGRGVSKIPAHFNIEYFPAELTNEKEVRELVSAIKPGVLIHAAAMSKPDECELNKEKCLLHNLSATKYLLEALDRTGDPQSHFIFTSTDFVFGENGPHSEHDIPAPLNFYGESKLRAEKLVGKADLSTTIIRPVFIYGPVWEGMRLSYLQQVKASLEQNKTIKAVSDQRRTPTYVYDVCKGIEQVIIQNKTGIYHLAGKDILSPYQMAVSIADYFVLNRSLIEDVTLDSFFEAARRPLHSGLTIEKARRELNYEPVSFGEGVIYTFGQ